MIANNEVLTPFIAIHPGVVLKDEINARETLTQRDLARQMGVKPSYLNEVIKGKRPITADFALLLEEALEIDAGFWMKYQTGYEIDKARIKERNQIKVKNINTWKKIQQYVSVKELKNNNLLSNNLQDDIETVFKYYNVSDVEELKDAISQSK